MNKSEISVKIENNRIAGQLTRVRHIMRRTMTVSYAVILFKVALGQQIVPTGRALQPMTGLPPLRNPFCVATVTSSSVVISSADDIMYSKVASYTGLQLSFMTLVFRLDSLARPGSRYSFTYGSGIWDGSLSGIFLCDKGQC